MTQEDRAIVIGLAVIAKQDAKRKLAELRAHAARLGTRYRNLGEVLCSNPESLKFEGKILSKSGFQLLDSFRLAEFNPQEAADLAEEIRTAIEEVERTTAEAAKLGY